MLRTALRECMARNEMTAGGYTLGHNKGNKIGQKNMALRYAYSTHPRARLVRAPHYAFDPPMGGC